jgi:hypothetical protein
MEFIMDITIRLWDALFDWPLGTVIGVIGFLALFFSIALVVWGLFVAVDSWFRPRRQDRGRVVRKEFIPAHMKYDVSLKMSTLHPDDWLIEVRVADQKDEMSVDEEFFNRISEGDVVIAEYVLGRFSNLFYLKGVSRI